MSRKALAAAIIIIIIIIAALVTIIIIKPGKKVSDTAEKDVPGLDDEMCDILWLASLSPNSHNIQSWRVAVYPEDHQITIGPDDDRKLAVVDPENRELFISLGCYAETLMHALSAFGYDAEFSYDPSGHQCNINYNKNGSAANSADAELIKKRHTDKRPFISGKTIEDEIVRNVIETDGDISFYASDTAGFASIRSTTLAAYEQQAYDRDAAGELSDWLRLSDSETIEKKDGLPAELLGIEGLKKILYYGFTDHESAKGETFARQGISTCEKQVDNCSGFIVISGENDEASLVGCGRKTVDLWLRLADNDIAVQPLSYALEDDEYRSVVSETCGGVQPQMLLRAGYVGDYGENAGIRRDLSDYAAVSDSR